MGSNSEDVLPLHWFKDSCSTASKRPWAYWCLGLGSARGAVSLETLPLGEGKASSSFCDLQRTGRTLTPNFQMNGKGAEVGSWGNNIFQTRRLADETILETPLPGTLLGTQEAEWVLQVVRWNLEAHNGWECVHPGELGADAGYQATRWCDLFSHKKRERFFSFPNCFAGHFPFLRQASTTCHCLKN